MIDVKMIKKSNIYQGSLKYELGQIKNPSVTTFIMNSNINVYVIN